MYKNEDFVKYNHITFERTGIDMKDLLYIVYLSLGSITEMYFLTKLMGYRQMSEMSMFDYIVGITIGSIAAEMATSLDKNFMQPVVAMLVYALVSIVLSLISNKSLFLRRFIIGKPLVLYHNNVLYRENMKKAKFDLSELLGQCRISGYFDLNEVETIILEMNGKLSILPKSQHRPVTPEDLQLKTDTASLCANLILDGKLLKDNLKQSGKDEIWLIRQLHALGYKSYKDVLLATCDLNGSLSVYPMKVSSKGQHDVLT